MSLEVILGAKLMPCSTNPSDASPFPRAVEAYHIATEVEGADKDETFKKASSRQRFDP